jgi:hypothetical protein
VQQRLYSSSDGLPQHLGDDARAAAWYEVMNSGGFSIDYTAAPERPFWCSLSIMEVGGISLARSAGTTVHAERTRRHIAADGREGFRLFLNQSGSAMRWRHPSTEFDLGFGEAFLTAASEPGQLHTTSGSYVDFITVPAERLAALHADFGSALQRRIPIGNDSLVLLRRYWQLLAWHGELGSPALVTHAETTLLDLLALPRERRAMQPSRPASAASGPLASLGCSRVSAPGSPTRISRLR